VNRAADHSGKAGHPQVAPIYAAGFVTTFGAHAVGANLWALRCAPSQLPVGAGLLLGAYDGAEVVRMARPPAHSPPARGLVC
jgi:hypothetical protein